MIVSTLTSPNQNLIIFSQDYFNRFKSLGLPHRGGFRGGDLVACQPLFSDMTLQSQILVIDSLFLTLVSKYIRKYLLSRQFSYMYSSCSNPALATIFFQEKLSINESSITVLDFRALSWDNVGFLWKSQCGVRRCATAYGMFYACKCSLDLAIPYRKNIQSPAVTRCRIPEIFCHQIQKRRDSPYTWWLPGDSFLFRQI